MLTLNEQRRVHIYIAIPVSIQGPSRGLSCTGLFLLVVSRGVQGVGFRADCCRVYGLGLEWRII